MFSFREDDGNQSARRNLFGVTNEDWEDLDDWTLSHAECLLVSLVNT